MITTLFILFAFLRDFPWSRKRMRSKRIEEGPPLIGSQHTVNPPSFNENYETFVPKDDYNLQQHPNINDISPLSITVPTTSDKSTSTSATILTTSNSSNTSDGEHSLKLQTSRLKTSKSIKAYEVTFSGSVRDGDSDDTTTTTRSNRLIRQSRSYTIGGGSILSRPMSPDSNSSSTKYKSYVSTHSHQAQTSSDYETAASELLNVSPTKTSIHLEQIDVQRSPNNGCLKHSEYKTDQDKQMPLTADTCDLKEVEFNDHDTEKFYSNIQDAPGTSGGNRNKRASLFSRSDSSATTTSSSGNTFTGAKRRSNASVLSTSLCSDIIPYDRRRSSTTTEYSVRSTGSQNRRSSTRVRRHISRITIGGARRRTTGRYLRLT